MAKEIEPLVEVLMTSAMLIGVILYQNSWPISELIH